MEDRQKAWLNSNLFLNQETNLPVSDLRYDKLTFNNKKHKFHNKFVQTGAVMIVAEGTKMMPRACADHSMLSTTGLSAISHHKKIKLHHAMKEPHKDGAGRVEKGHKFYKSNREHKEHKTFESKTRERDHEGGKSTLELSCSSLRKSTEKQGKERGKKMAKVAYKDHKMTSRESKDESGGQVDLQALSKRPLSSTDSSNQSTKKQKRLKGCKEEGLITISSRTPSTNSAPTSTYLETKGPKIKMRHETPITKTRTDSYSNSENETFSRDVQRSVRSMTSSSCSSSSSDSEFEPLQMQSQGPLHFMVEHRLSQHAENSRCLEVETAMKARPAIQDSCLFMDSDSDVEESYPQSQKKPSPIAKLNTKNLNLLQKENPDSSKKEKVLHRDKLGKAYTEELVDLHRRLMALRERNILQQIVNLIEKTGHFNITKSTFDFDLFSLDEPTVRKLQSYLPAKST